MDIILNELEQERIINKGDNFFIAKDKLKLGESLVFRTPAYEVLGFGSVKSCLELETKVEGNNVKVYLVHFER